MEYVNLENEINNLNTKIYMDKKKELKTKYLSIVLDNNTSRFIKNNKNKNEEIEKKCLCENFKIEINEGYYTCYICGLVYGIYIDCSFNHTSYESLRDVTRINEQIYEKKNHFMEIWTQKQAKQNTVLPKNVMDAIYEQIKRRRIKDLTKIDEKIIKEFLKRTNNAQYYEQSYCILKEINNETELNFNDKLTNKVFYMFLEYEKAYEETKDINRKSSISYNYVIHKILELLNCNDYKKRFNLPKDINKIIEYDIIWKKICNLNNWNFINSERN